MRRESGRKHYRVTYPADLRPGLWIAGRQLVLVDVSETGIRYLPADPAVLHLGAALAGDIRFHRGRTVPVEGRVVRLDGGEAAVQLIRRVPFAAILEEELWLSKHLPPQE